MPPVRNGLCARNNARGRGKAVAILPPGVEAVVLTVIQQMGGRWNARPTLRAERALICGSKCRKPILRKRSSLAAAKKGKQGIQKGRKTHTGCPPLLPPRRAAHRPRTPRSEASREFCRRRIGEIAALPQVDFQAEEEYFRRCIEINS